MNTTRLRDHAILIAGTLLMAAPLVLVFIGAGDPGGLRGSWRPGPDYVSGLLPVRDGVGVSLRVR